MKNKIFITGIGTDVGKTVVSAIIAEALQADYWKPIQAGEIENTDTLKVKRLISNNLTKFHAEYCVLKEAMSPHAAADLEGFCIKKNDIRLPKTENNLVIEGAGGLMVPINHKETILDLISPTYKVIIVSRNYLGSINHTLLTLEVLRQKGIEPLGIIFNGDKNEATESIIKEMTNIPVIGCVRDLSVVDKRTIFKEASKLKQKLAQYLIL